MSQVPCGSCRACCSKQLVAILPEDESNLPFYKTIAYGPGLKVLDVLPNGDCIHYIGAHSHSMPPSEILVLREKCLVARLQNVRAVLGGKKS